MLDAHEESCDRPVADTFPAYAFVLVLEPNYFAAEYQRRHVYPFLVPVAPRSALPIARASDGHQRRRNGDPHFEFDLI
jgi:hypothetical protein